MISKLFPHLKIFSRNGINEIVSVMPCVNEELAERTAEMIRRSSHDDYARVNNENGVVTLSFEGFRKRGFNSDNDGNDAA